MLSLNPIVHLQELLTSDSRAQHRLGHVLTSTVQANTAEMYSIDYLSYIVHAAGRVAYAMPLLLEGIRSISMHDSATIVICPRIKQPNLGR